jgi:hypothetical protein
MEKRKRRKRKKRRKKKRKRRKRRKRVEDSELRREIEGPQPLVEASELSLCA